MDDNFYFNGMPDWYKIELNSWRTQNAKSMGYQVYKVGKRWGGYEVPAYCEYPGCNEEIDRGMPYACGGEPFSEYGCDRYFCSKHREYHCFNTGYGERKCIEVCERCAKSKGTLAEIEVAKEKGIPIYYSLEEIK